MTTRFVAALFTVVLASSAPAWMADNGNGTFTNPLFYDEFSDPDLIRVGNDFYLTGTTMHAMPGLPILHSRDLVNWELLGYALERLDLGPEFRLEDGKDIYGQGIWAPSFRYCRGTFYIFSNVNRRTTQIFRATNPAGPWTRTAMKRAFHDLSVLFDDDGKVYVIWGYQEINFAQLNEELTDIVPGSQRVVIQKSAGMGEGVHFYKIDGRYFITSAWFGGRMRMPCARADRPEGPYEVNEAISTDEDFGLAEGYRLRNGSPPFGVVPPNTRDGGRMSLHQGGVVNTPTGEWWGFSMMDYNSVGRLTCLSPVTWTNGWPYFGLAGNLQRTPRTWLKPKTGPASPPSVAYVRNDNFSGPKLAKVWQWNHVPDDTKWSLTERAGFLRLYSLPAPDFWRARDTLTQRGIGPESSPTADLDASGLKPGDVAGLALLNLPYAWIGLRCQTNCMILEQFNQLTGETASAPFTGSRVSLRAHCNFLTEKARFSYSTHGKTFAPLGGEFTMIFQLRTFQGVRYSLFAYNTGGAPGGYADFDKFTVEEPHPGGLMRPIPFGRTITLTNVRDGAVLSVGGATRFKVVDRGYGRIALQSGSGLLSVDSQGGHGKVTVKAGETTDAETFQWTETPYGDLILLSLATHRHLRVESGTGAVFADSPGPKPDRKDGSCLGWSESLPGALR